MRKILLSLISIIGQIFNRSKKGLLLNTTVIDKLQAFLSPEMVKVDELMRERMKSDKVSLIEQIASHLINSGGKRIRQNYSIMMAQTI